jgi:hypothetical protein
MKNVLEILICLLLVPNLVQAQEKPVTWSASATSLGIIVNGPTEPINRNTQVTLSVEGLSDDDLKNASVVCEPSKGVVMIPAKVWGGPPIIIFSSGNPGAHTVTVGVNAKHASWRKHLADSFLEATAAGVESELLKEFDTFQLKTATAYPAKLGTCIVEVAGNIPPPEPGPAPPDPPLEVGKRRVIIVHETADTTSKLSDLFVQLRHPNMETDKYLKSKGHKLEILDINLIPNKLAWIKATSGKNLPVLIVADHDTGVVLSADEINESLTPGELVNKVKAKGG